MAGGKPDGEHVHAAGEGDDRVIGDAQDQQARATHAAELPPQRHR
jgi:hypothetical protein